MQDPALEYALRTLGYLVGSHVMSRSDGSPRTGRYEEILTADLADMFLFYGTAMRGYLDACGTNSWLRVGVCDLHKQAEASTGADLVFAFRFAEELPDGSVRYVRKTFLVQAKRQDVPRAAYAASANNRAHAKKMFAMSGGHLAACAFVLYHSSTALRPLGAVSTPWPVDPSGANSGPPLTFFATPNQGTFAFAPHQHTLRNIFIELSGYRYWANCAMARRSSPAEHAWGATMLGAEYFLHPSGRARRGRTALPSMAHVGQHGMPLDQWLVEVADCNVGVNHSDDASFETAVHAACGTSVRADRAQRAPFAPGLLITLTGGSGARLRALHQLSDPLRFEQSEQLGRWLDPVASERRDDR